MRVSSFLLITVSVACSTHLFQVKENNELYYLNHRQKWSKQHPQPVQKRQCLFILVTNLVDFRDVLQSFWANTKLEFVRI